ncbi:response regulator [Burkholderia cenocepacia]
MDTKHRVLIVEDQHLLRVGLSHLVAELADYCIVGAASGGVEACALAEKTRPDLILMDLSMPGGSGFEAIATIKRNVPHVRIIVLTVHRSEDDVSDAFAAGADGYVVKDSPFADLVREMRFVMQGKCVVSLDAYRARAGLHGLRDEHAHKARLWRALTSRERTVLRLVVEGHAAGRRVPEGQSQNGRQAPRQPDAQARHRQPDRPRSLRDRHRRARAERRRPCVNPPIDVWSNWGGFTHGDARHFLLLARTGVIKNAINGIGSADAAGRYREVSREPSIVLDTGRRAGRAAA